MLPSFWCLEFPGVSSVISFSEAHPPGRREGRTCAPAGPARHAGRAPGPQQALRKLFISDSASLSPLVPDSCLGAPAPPASSQTDLEELSRPGTAGREARLWPVLCGSRAFLSLSRGTGQGPRPWPRSLRHPPAAAASALSWPGGTRTVWPGWSGLHQPQVTELCVSHSGKHSVRAAEVRSQAGSISPNTRCLE